MASRLLLFSSSSTSPFLSAARPLTNRTHNSLFRLQQLQRTMADSAPQTEWLVVVPDFPNTIQKRLDIRPTHFANLEPVKSRLKFGGAILKDKPSDPADPKTFDFAGSSFIVLADSKQEVIEFLKKDVYVEAGVWDVANAQIYAMKTAFRVP